MAVDTIARGIAAGRVPVSAYDMAVAGGYTGTKEEFEADIGNSGTNATNAANSAAAAAASAAEASGIADDLAQYKTDTMTAPANITAGEYVLAAGTLYVATANIASGATLTPNGNVTQVTVGEELTEVIASNANKADQNGNYPNLTAGNALQLVSTVGVEDRVPYNFRTSGGSADIGDRETDKIVGGTLAWNQLIQNGNFADNSGWNASIGATFSVQDNKATTSNTTASYISLFRSSTVRLQEGHKYLYSADVSCTTGRMMFLPSGSTAEGYKTYTDVSTEKNCAFILAPSSDFNANFTIRFMVTTSGTSEEITGTVRNYCCFDLTQMFGSTIADYIYSLEQSNAGDGVAWFRKLFPKPYYAYDAGSLQSVQTSAHKMVGFNAFDARTADDGHVFNNVTGAKVANTVWSCQFIKVVPGAQYYLKSPRTTNFYNVVYYDADRKCLADGFRVDPSASGGAFTVPDNCGYVGVNTLTENKGSVCLNLSWDGEKDGTYEPYVEYNYPLDSSLTLRGIPELDSNNKLRNNGDVYESNGTVTRRYGIVDLGTLTWSYSQSNAYFHAVPSESADYPKIVSAGAVGYAVCTVYVATSFNAMYNHPNGDNMVMSLTNGTNNHKIYIRNTAYTDPDAFKTAMSGIYLIYELETPTTESAEPYTNPQIVDDFGTEEYVDAGVAAGTRDVAIPVGHETLYQQNLKSKLEMMADSPSGDGDYILRQTGGENAYVPLVIPAELPQIPGTDGVYTLKATVTDGTAVLSWEAMS